MLGVRQRETKREREKERDRERDRERQRVRETEREADRDKRHRGRVDRPTEKSKRVQKGNKLATIKR